ncbi:GIY-YIG nuclease family protein [Agrobacterium vitis]
MDQDNTSRIPVWGVARLNPGYIYVIQNTDGLLKIGKSKNRKNRLREAKTWLPDADIIGIKPFWLVDRFEKQLHEGLSQWWYSGEWFKFGDDPYVEDFLENFRAFSDEDIDRDENTIDFLYLINEFGEISLERASAGVSLRGFQRNISEMKK